MKIGDFCGRPYIYGRLFPIQETPEPVSHPGLTLRPDQARALVSLLNQAFEICEFREKAAMDEPEVRPQRRRRR
jgi:hypothetical protein